ncbi:MAG: hypothetical protein Q7U05_08400 [Polaromonas sp.]|nr:hypothetical protein [Polaromonas sp.]
MDSVDSAQKWWDANTNVAARKQEPNQTELADGEIDEDHNMARTRREIAEANMAEIREADLLGKYLDKAQVDSAIFEIARAMRDGLTNCSRRIAADVAGLVNAGDCEEVIDREHRALLENMSHRMHANIGNTQTKI